MSKTSIGKQIRAARQSLGLTQAQYVALYNATSPITVTTTRADLSKYEVGITTPPADKFLKLLALAK